MATCSFSGAGQGLNWLPSRDIEILGVVHKGGAQRSGRVLDKCGQGRGGKGPCGRSQTSTFLLFQHVL